MDVKRGTRFLCFGQASQTSVQQRTTAETHRRRESSLMKQLERRATIVPRHSQGIQITMQVEIRQIECLRGLRHNTSSFRVASILFFHVITRAVSPDRTCVSANFCNMESWKLKDDPSEILKTNALEQCGETVHYVQAKRLPHGLGRDLPGSCSHRLIHTPRLGNFGLAYRTSCPRKERPAAAQCRNSNKD